MPIHSEHIIHDSPPQDNPQSQVKLCSSCHCPLSTDSAQSSFLVQDGQDSTDAAIVCGPCRTRLIASVRSDPPIPPTEGFLFAEVERELLRRAASLQDDGHEANNLDQIQATRPHHVPVHSCSDEDMDIESHESRLMSISTAPAPQHSNLYLNSPSTAPSRIPTSSKVSLTVHINYESASSSPAHSLSSSRALPYSASGSKAQYHREQASFSPDPLVDITRLRVRSQGHHCLYPGATFQGTQKSGRHSYDVNVTIVDVDFACSHLCGYLRIRGLTDDWPELTTYFDAEIIGSRYGFLTRNWGATEQEDMVHWARFPAFRHVRHELKKPHLTMKDADRGAVFMRWKEKFLVPDHRVQDINGASFAGFYYVCVDFNPQSTAILTTQAEDMTSTSPVTSSKPERSPRARRESVSRGTRPIDRSSSRGAASNVATMSGFYFHQNSEPYQQLSLVHVPERANTCFEFR
ncbi:vacuolar import and degradation protein-domain-containing protein [Abortiporus biennis]|nr:vacuolar import and degradation protein-domain-containing protein [Abortiporus biennis]